MTVLKKILSILMIAALVVSIVAMGALSTGAAATGTGLAEWAMRAYNEGWRYVWGGDSVGAVDCSGMITSYCGGNRTSMLADAKAHGRAWGYVSEGVPNIHGLGLSRPNHVGVYVGNGMEVDARGSDYGVCYQAVGSRWECWFKLTAITYPTTGWQTFNGDSYYYENGEYLANTTRTIDGVTYTFDQSGAASSAPSSAVSSSKSEAASASSASVKADDNAPLKKGSTGSRVIKLQERLQALGYYEGAVDGDYGALTEQAFKLFQKQVGLTEDGIAGSDADYLYADDAPAYTPVEEVEATEAKAVEAPAKRGFELAATGTNTVDDEEDTDSADDPDAIAQDSDEQSEKRYANGDSSDEIAVIQERLIALGYLDGAADGIFGSMTEAAVKEFQTVNRLDGTGVVDSKTYETLFSASAVKHPADAADEPVSPTAAGIAATTAQDTTVERDNAALSQQSVAAISETVAATSAAATPNLEFIVWLGIMIVVMLIAFIVVFIVEKKRARTITYVGRRFQ